MTSKPSDKVQAAVAMMQADEARLLGEIARVREQSREQLQALGSQLRLVRRSLAPWTRAKTAADERKPRLTRELVMGAVDKALEAGPQSYDELKTKVLEQARGSGINGTGVHLILQRVVSDPQFEQQNGLYQLRSNLPHAAT